MDDSHNAKVASDHDEGTKSNGLTVTDELKQHIISTAKWAKLFAVLGFIIIGIYACSLLLILSMDRFEPVAAMTIIFFIFIYYFPVSYLWKFATRTIEGIENDDQERFEEGFSQLNSHFRYVGILTIIGLSLIVLSFFLGFLGKGY